MFYTYKHRFMGSEDLVILSVFDRQLGCLSSGHMEEWARNMVEVHQLLSCPPLVLDAENLYNPHLPSLLKFVSSLTVALL